MEKRCKRLIRFGRGRVPGCCSSTQGAWAERTLSDTHTLWMLRSRGNMMHHVLTSPLMWKSNTRTHTNTDTHTHSHACRAHPPTHTPPHTHPHTHIHTHTHTHTAREVNAHLLVTADI